MKRIATFFLVFIICFSVMSPSALAASRDTSLEQELATDLKALSLFKGVSDTNFDLNRAPTRTETIVMLIRVLGKESEALNGSWAHPFTDVETWANKYVGYAYQKGLTKGVSDTQFGSGNATAATYLTFVLRALGYSDTNGADFTFDNPYTLAKSISILPGRVDTSEFLRADVVLISYSALPVKLKGSSQALCDKLINDAVFTKQQYSTYYDATAINAANTKTALSAEEVYAKCSPSVFYIEVFNKDGKVFASGSGFFIDSAGTAVTNFHVIKGACSAKITTSDTKKVYNVTGVYDYNTTQDWAVLKIDGSGFSYLNIGSTSTVVGGATVYAIGSPLGLQSTITQGLISNANRVDNGISYIQTSAAISSGSSGGALLNKYGEVVGITSASYVSGQNLNLALPMTYLSNISKSTIKSLSEVAGSSTSTSTTTSLDVSSSNVAVKAGASSTIYVKWIGGSEEDSVYWDSSNENVATAAWGDWISDDVLALKINGISSGTATLTVYVDDQHSCNINVTVGLDSAYNILKKAVSSKGTYSSTLGGYVLGGSVDSTKYYIVYRQGNQHDLCIFSDSYIDGYHVFTTVSLYEGDVAAYNVEISSPAIEGAGYLAKSSFDEAAVLTLQTYSGDSSYRNKLISISSGSICQLLDGIECTLKYYNIPITINDLGFETFYKEWIG